MTGQKTARAAFQTVGANGLTSRCEKRCGQKALGAVGVSVSENTRSVVEGESRSPERPDPARAGERP